MRLRRLRTLPSMSLTPTSTTSSPTTPATSTANPLRPCQRAYLGTSNARRMLKRAQLSAITPADDPIFALHDEAIVHDALLALAAPFDTSISPSPSASASMSALAAPATATTSKTTGYTVSCYATHAEDAHRLRAAAAHEQESLLLLRSLNSARRVEGRTAPLVLLPGLCASAQQHADALYADELHATAYIPYVPHVTVRTPRSGRRRATLVSPASIGALACAEMWYGGKYRRHLYGVRPAVGMETGDGGGEEEDEGAGGASRLHHRHHHPPEDCPCHLRIVFETMVDEGWRVVGIGRGGEGGKGRWVVEFGE